MKTLSNPRYEVKPTHTPRVTSQIWRGRAKSRPGSRGFTIIPNEVIDHSDNLNDGELRTLNLYISMVDNVTGLLQIGMAALIARRGRSDATIKRHNRKLELVGHLEIQRDWNPVLGCWRENVYKVHRVPIRPQTNQQTIETTSTNDPTPGVTDELLLLINTSTNTEKLNPPTPLQGGGVFTPDPEAIQALHEARRLRAERKASRRQRRYTQAREEKRRERTPVQMAARKIMAMLAVSPALAGTRRAIETAVEHWMKRYGKDADWSVNPLVASWKDYEIVRDSLEYPCGMMTFFGGMKWVDGRWAGEKHFLRHLRNQAWASIGRYRPPERVDLAAVKAKMAALGVNLEEPYGEESTIEGCATSRAGEDG